MPASKATRPPPRRATGCGLPLVLLKGAVQLQQAEGWGDEEEQDAGGQVAAVRKGFDLRSERSQRRSSSSNVEG